MTPARDPKQFLFNQLEYALNITQEKTNHGRGIMGQDFWEAFEKHMGSIWEASGTDFKEFDVTSTLQGKFRCHLNNYLANAETQNMRYFENEICVFEDGAPSFLRHVCLLSEVVVPLRVLRLLPPSGVPFRNLFRRFSSFSKTSWNCDLQNQTFLAWLSMQTLHTW